MKIRLGPIRVLSSVTMFWTWIVAVSLLLSSVRLLTPSAFGVTVVVTAMFCFGFVPQPDQTFIENFRRITKELWAFCRDRWVFGMLFALLFVWLCWEFYLILFLPPVTWDALTYHLPMIAGWLQRGYVGPYETTTIRQIYSPVNGEILQMFHVLFLGDDVVVQMAQWESVIIAFIGVFVIARYAQLSRSWALISAFSIFTVPLLLLQSHTTQNDLIVVCGMVLMLVWFSGFIAERNSWMLLLLGLIFGVVVGVKLHMVIGGAVMSGIVLISFWRIRKEYPMRRSLMIFLSAAVPSVLLMGSAVYLRNYIAFGQLIPPIGMIPNVYQTGMSTVGENLLHFGKWWLVTCWDYISPETWNQDQSHYGPLFGYVILTVGMAGTVIAAKRLFSREQSSSANIIVVAASTLALGVWLGFAYGHRPRPFDLRYMLFMPVLMSISAFSALERVRALRENAVAIALFVVICFTMSSTLVNAELPSVRTLSESDPWMRSTSQMKGVGPHTDLYVEFDKLSHAGDNVLVVGSEDDWSYPLFGHDLSRHVYYAATLDRFEWYLRNYEIKWIVIRRMEPYSPIVDRILSRKDQFALVINSRDLNGNFFGTTLSLFRVEEPKRDPTWFSGIDGDHLTRKSFSLGTDTPGRFLLELYVDPIFGDSLRVYVTSPDSLVRTLHFMQGDTLLAFEATIPGEFTFVLSKSYRSSHSDDTRELGLSIKDIQFEYDPGKVYLAKIQTYP
jgi:hypothetical protein